MSVYVKRTKKNGVKVITSSYFDDVKMLRESMRDSGISQMRHDKECHFDISRLMVESAAKQIALWKQGCYELSQYVQNMKEPQWKNYETEYMGEDYVPTDECAPVLSEEEAERQREVRLGKRMKFN